MALFLKTPLGSWVPMATLQPQVVARRCSGAQASRSS